MMTYSRRSQAVFSVFMVLLTSAAVAAGEPALPAATAPGLIGHYRSTKPGSQAALTRIDPSVAFDWTDGTPDARLPRDGFSVTWEGLVRVEYPGTYRFQVAGSSRARVFLDGRQVFPAAAGESQPAVSLAGAACPIRVCCDVPADGTQVRLIWSSDSFPAEVVNSRYLLHLVQAEDSVARDLAWRRGRLLVQRYGCGRCHPIPGIDRSGRPGLAMPHVLEMKPEWVAAWLRDPQAVRPGTRMGSPGGTPQEMEVLISNLLALVEQPPVRERIDAKWHCGGRPDPLDQGDAAQVLVPEGRQRFYELGCSACHAPETPELIDPTRGPSLADVGSKWPRAYLRQLMLDPVGRHPTGGCPRYELVADDVDRLVAYMSTFELPKSGETDKNSPAVPTKTVLKLSPGQMLLDPKVLPDVKAPFLGRSCHACHSPEGTLVDGPVLAPPLSESEKGCLRADRSASWAPQYHLPAEDRAAVIEFLSRPILEPSPVASCELARRTMEERLNCLGCHRRNGAGGEPLTATLPAWLSANSKAELAATTPPDLSGVGSRLLRPWILQVLDGKAKSNRPWLTVKMPSFGLSEAERTAIADRLAVEDFIPDLDRIADQSLPRNLPAVGPELISQRGFNCVNCHCLREEEYTPGKPGPILSMATGRVSRQWYHRWLSGPSRILPATPMPTFDKPAPSIAGGDGFTQREIIWRYLMEFSATANGR